MRSVLTWLAIPAVILLGVVPHEVRAADQESEERTALAVYDQILDTRVRDGFVYYRLLKVERRGLDRFVTSLAGAELPRDRNEQIAFWLNAYNALVLQTVVNHYPTRSLRQVTGVFTRPHRVAGRMLSLDQIEQTILPAFRDPRVFLALGRGAAGSGRLRSEIYTGESIERQLRDQMEECAIRDHCVRVDAVANRLRASQIFQWRGKEFTDAFANVDGKRPPLERAVVAYAGRRSLDAERECIATDRFKVEYVPFDWSLNDLATRRR
jgi:hypothetical protein